MKLHRRLLLLLVPLIAAPMAALGWVAYIQQRDSLEQEALRQMRTLLEQVDKQVQARLEVARANAVLFSNSDLLQRYLLVEDEGQRFQIMQPSLLKFFQSYQKAYPEYYEIRVLLPDGYEDTRSTLGVLPNLTDEEGDSDYFGALSQTTDGVYTQVLRNPDNGMPVLLVSKSIKSVDPNIDPILAKPKLRGFLVITMDLDFLQQQSDNVKLGNAGHVFFTDAASRVLFAPTSLEHGNEPLPELSSILQTTHDTDTGLRADHLGESALIDSKKLHENLHVFVVLPEREIIASIRTLAWIVLGFIVATVAITAALLYAALHSLLLKPLAVLGRSALAIGRGETVTDIDIERSDEIGDLARSFAVMNKNLSESRHEIMRLAYHDSLTGLPNRRLFNELVKNALAHARRTARCVALLFLDLDDFKRVNDTLGHKMGDDLLREVAKRLTSVIRSSDVITHSAEGLVGNTVARMGGDEFIILLVDIQNKLDAAIVSRRILSKFKHPVPANGHELHIKTSIGISTFPEDGDSTEELIKNADNAMYHAKEGGKNHYQFFDKRINQTLVERMAMETALRKAIEHDELLLHYQPQVDAWTGEIVGIEALVRWQSPERGLIPPGEFIPLAEETGLITSVGDWVLYEACRQHKAWQEAGHRPVGMSVNISSRQFAGAGLSQHLARVIADTGINPCHLNLEVTETAVITDPAKTTATLLELKNLGVSISMDDFGTGYSSLNMLKRLPIDCLKVDRGFIKDITSDPYDAGITATIIAMSKNLHLNVIAEGVETLEQLEILRGQGCGLIQGFLASRPVPAEKMTQLLAARRVLLEERSVTMIEAAAPLTSAVSSNGSAGTLPAR